MKPPIDSLALRDLGQRIARFRDEKGLSQDDLAFRTGITRGYISAVENGRHDVGVMTFARISEALGVSMDRLYYGDAIRPESEQGPRLLRKGDW